MEVHTRLRLLSGSRASSAVRAAEGKGSQIVLSGWRVRNRAPRRRRDAAAGWPRSSALRDEPPVPATRDCHARRAGTKTMSIPELTAQCDLGLAGRGIFLRVLSANKDNVRLAQRLVPEKSRGDGRWGGTQKENFRATCIRRGGAALITWP